MSVGKAFGAGMIGGVAMAILMWMARALTAGMSMDLSMVLGTMFLPAGAAAWVLGSIMHLVVSGLIALVYAWGFEHVTHRAGALVGLAFSVIHSIGTGVFTGLVPMLHPRIPEAMPAPGYFLLRMGVMGVTALFAVHFVYGAIVGAVYGSAIHPARQPVAA
jgi:hypothetical protein